MLRRLKLLQMKAYYYCCGRCDSLSSPTYSRTAILTIISLSLSPSLPLPSYDYFIFLDDDVPGMLVHARVGQHCYECVATTGEEREKGRGDNSSAVVDSLHSYTYASEDEWTVFQGFLLRELPLVGYIAPMQDSTFHGVDDNDSGSGSSSGSSRGPRLITRGKAYVDAQLAAFHRTAIDGILLP